MISLYQRIYYELFLLWRKKNDQVANARYNAVLTLTLLVTANLYSLLTVVDVWLKFGFIELIVNTSRVELVLIFVLMLILNWLFLGRASSHTDIMRKFETQNGPYRYSTTAVFFYAILSLVLNPLLWLYLPPYNG